MTHPSRRLPATALAACMLGYVASPIPFLALAARAELPPLTAAILATTFALSAGLLLMRLLAKPPADRTSGVTVRMIELASWATVTSILLFISGMHLMRGIERWGSVSLVFLSASALCFPIVWVRHTALEQRLTRLPPAVIVAALCTLLLVTGATLCAYLTTPAKFL